MSLVCVATTTQSLYNARQTENTQRQKNANDDDGAAVGATKRPNQNCVRTVAGINNWQSSPDTR